MASQDIDSLFTNIALYDSLNIWLDLLFKKDNLISSLEKTTTNDWDALDNFKEINYSLRLPITEKVLQLSLFFFSFFCIWCNTKNFATVILFALLLTQKVLQVLGFSKFFSTSAVLLDGLTKFFCWNP